MANIDFYQVIDLIKNTGQRGQELLVDSFILGVAYGREQLIILTRQIRTIHEIEKAVTTLLQIKQQIDNGDLTPFIRDELFTQLLLNKNDNIFTNFQKKREAQLKPKQQRSKECGLCRLPFSKENDAEVCVLETCGHNFHIKCLYIYTQQNKNNCPICKIEALQDLPNILFEALGDEYRSCCPNPRCQNQFIYYGQVNYTCSKCKQCYCLNCKKKNHIGKSCNVDSGTLPMKIGDKFKYCEDCNRSFFLKNINDLQRCQCQYQQKQQQKVMERNGLLQNIWQYCI